MRREEGERLEAAYTGRPVETERDGTSYAAFPSAIGTDDHIEMRTRTEFDVIVS